MTLNMKYFLRDLMHLTSEEDQQRIFSVFHVLQQLFVISCCVERAVQYQSVLFQILPAELSANHLVLHFFVLHPSTLQQEFSPSSGKTPHTENPHSYKQFCFTRHFLIGVFETIDLTLKHHQLHQEMDFSHLRLTTDYFVRSKFL